MQFRTQFAPFLALLIGTSAATVSAQDPPDIANPPEFHSEASKVAPEALVVQPGQSAASPRLVLFDMNVVLAERRIFNPSKPGDDKYDTVALRTYEDARAPGPPGPDAELVGPTIVVVPGQTARVTLHNKLAADSTCGIGSGGSVNTPHCFNGTNLHSHGLWVNPAGNGDNVLITILPGVSFEYEYNVPPEHPAGTFWYHPHLHGSTALQVSSGMSGALIISGDRPPVIAPDGSISAGGDLDRLLKEPDGRGIAERILVLQQVQYACRYPSGEKKGQIQTDTDGQYVCDAGQVGQIDGYDLFGPGSWPTSGRHTSVNGRVLGRLAAATVGAVERWRLIHAGVRDTINFEIRHKTGTAPFATLSAAATDDWIEANCGAAVPFHVVAQDGLTMAAAQPRDQAILQPGYRVDALVAFSEPGDYCVVDGEAPAAGSVDQAAPSRRLLGIVAASGTATAEMASGSYLQEWLIAAAERTMPGDVVDKVRSDLRNGLKLSSFVPHPDVGDDELTGTQELVFNIDTTLPGATFFEIDGQPYDPNRVDRILPVGGVDEWTLHSNFVSHPFHIHVNPFQIVKILDAAGNDVSVLGAQDDGDPQYEGLKGVWKDTLWVKNPGFSAPSRYTIVVRTRYQRYIGDFVLHCHILDHEDQGMMQSIRIALPDGAGGTARSHH